MTEEEIKQNIIDRYNCHWELFVDEQDIGGLVQEAKDNFKETVELLISTIKQSYEKNRHLRVKKQREVIKVIPARSYVAGFPIAKNAFYNELYTWPNMKEVKL